MSQDKFASHGRRGRRTSLEAFQSAEDQQWVSGITKSDSTQSFKKSGTPTGTMKKSPAKSENQTFTQNILSGDTFGGKQQYQRMPSFEPPEEVQEVVEEEEEDEEEGISELGNTSLASQKPARTSKNQEWASKIKGGDTLQSRKKQPPLSKSTFQDPNLEVVEEKQASQKKPAARKNKKALQQLEDQKWANKSMYNCVFMCGVVLVFCLSLVCGSASSTEEPKALKIIPITTIYSGGQWGHTFFVDQTYLAKTECVSSSTDAHSSCDSLHIDLYAQVNINDVESGLDYNKTVSTLTAKLDRNEKGEFSAVYAGWNRLTCHTPGEANCLDIFNMTFYIMQDMLPIANPKSPYPSLIVQTSEKGDFNYDGSNVYLQTVDFSGHMEPMPGFYPLHFIGSTPGKMESGVAPYFHMARSTKDNSYVVSAMRDTGDFTGMMGYHQMLARYTADGQYEGVIHSFGFFVGDLEILGPSIPKVDPVSGRVVIAVHLTSNKYLEEAAKSFGITKLTIPEGVTVLQSSNVIFVTSPDTATLLSAVILPIFLKPDSCDFYTDDTNEPSRYVVCSGWKLTTTGSSDYYVTHLVVIDTKQNTVQMQPVPGQSSNSHPSSMFRIHMLSHSPCNKTVHPTDNGASVQALLYGEEGTHGSMEYGSRGVLQHVNLTHLFAAESDSDVDSNTDSYPALSADGTTLVVPKVTEWDSIAPDRILSRTIVAADNPSSHRNAVTELKSVVPELPNIFLLVSQFHGPTKHTAWKNARCHYQMQLVDICESVDGPVDPGHEPSKDGFWDSLSMTERLLVSVGGVLACGALFGVMIWIRKRQQSSSESTSKPLLERSGNGPVPTYTA